MIDRTMTAKYPGKCARTGEPIRKGETIIKRPEGWSKLTSADTARVDQQRRDIASDDFDQAQYSGRW